MVNQTISWSELEYTLELIVERQQKELLMLGRRIIPSLTSEDLLQPNDYLELNHHPEFRYEEGMLAGFLTIQMAIRALRRDRQENP